MADTKITGLTADTTPTGDDLVVLVNDPGGTPANRKASLSDTVYDKVPGANGTRTITGITTLTNADYGKTVRCNSATLFTLTLPTPVSGEETASIDIINVNDGVVTISAGTNGINRLGNDTFTIVKDQRVVLTVDAVADPMWVAEVVSSQALAVNEYISSDGTNTEARTDKGTVSGSIHAAANDTYVVTHKTPFALTVDSVDLETEAGTVTVAVRDDESAMTGVSAISATTTNANTAVDDAVASGSKFDLVLTGESSLTELWYSINYTRTGD